MSNNLVNLLSRTDLSRKDKMLILLSQQENSCKPIGELKILGMTNGLREISKWNVSMILKSLKGLAVKLPDGWVLTVEGKNLLVQNGFTQTSPIISHHSNLISLAAKMQSKYVQDFVLEAIASLEYKLLKSAIVFSWVGAISVLYEFVEKNHLLAFNTEAKRRDAKWKDATNIDGLTRMKEYDFLQILEAISIIGKNTKSELEQCLKLRNSCGHPSTLKIGENKVASHIEILILNVFSQY